MFSVHQFIHLADEYKQFGPLDNVSGFPFENYLGQIKHLLRKPNQPLQQVVKRLSEMPQVELPLATDEPVLQNIHTDGPLPLHFSAALQYTKVSTSRFTLSTKQGDNCIQVGDTIAVVQNIVEEQNKVYVIYRTFRQCESYYTYPCESSCIGTYKVRELCTGILGVGKLSCIKRKCVLCPGAEGDGLIAIPIAHMQ